MTLKERYHRASDQELIEVIENNKSYTIECVKVVAAEIAIRNISKADMKNHAHQLMTEKIRDILDRFSPLNDELFLPVSELLEEAEIRQILRSEFDRMVERRKIDVEVWRYAIGAYL